MKEPCNRETGRPHLLRASAPSAGVRTGRWSLGEACHWEGTHSGDEIHVDEGLHVERSGVAHVREMGESRVAREPRGVQRGHGGGSLTLGKLWGLRRVSGLNFIKKHTQGPLDGEWSVTLTMKSKVSGRCLSLPLEGWYWRRNILCCLLTM